MNEHILLVEDDAAIADALRLHLEQAGYSLHHESDGEAALARLDSERWDLILLDLMLPGVDGWDLCRHVRQHHAGVPVIILSARSAEAQRVLGLELGADDYMAKPFSMLELVARMRALFRRIEQMRSQPPLPAQLRFGVGGRFRLDTSQRRLLNGDAPVALTQREYELLAFLARHAGRTFGRDELLSRVWGSGFDGFEHTVNSHINRLRNKVEDEPREPRLIVTVWGEGYRLEALR